VDSHGPCIAPSAHSQIVTLALPTATAPDWAVAPDAVQAVSCLVEALHLYMCRGKSFLYDAGTEAVLDVLMHLSHSPSYLMIITGAPAQCPASEVCKAWCHCEALDMRLGIEFQSQFEVCWQCW
jgi:hypothetical protein